MLQKEGTKDNTRQLTFPGKPSKFKRWLKLFFVVERSGQILADVRAASMCRAALADKRSGAQAVLKLRMLQLLCSSTGQRDAFWGFVDWDRHQTQEEGSLVQRLLRKSERGKIAQRCLNFD